MRDVLARPRGGLVSLGAVLALWAASAGFTSVMDGLNLAYRVRESRPWWRVRLIAIGLTVALSAFMIVAFVLAVFGGLIASGLGPHLGPAAVPVLLGARWAIVVTVVTAVAATIYYACPDVEQEAAWVTPGSLLFTLGFGASSAASAAHAAIESVKSVWQKTPKGEWHSLAVVSNGEYGAPEGLQFGFPVRSDGKGWEIVEGLEHGDFAKEKIKLTTDELLGERQEVEDLLG